MSCQLDPQTIQATIAFHGHSCPGLAIGMRAAEIALQEMVEAVRISKERVERLEAAIEAFVPTWSLAPIVRALQGKRCSEALYGACGVCSQGMS